MQLILDKLKNTQGKIGFYYVSLDSDEVYSYQADLPVVAASVIKIPVMIEAFRRFEAGTLEPDSEYILREPDKMPSCGVLNRMHAGLHVTIRDLVELMIVLSDNTATNILIDMLGIENINKTMSDLGIKDTKLRRKLFDSEAASRGIENSITAGEIGTLLTRMYKGELISPAADAQMLEILANQKLNGKIPFFLHSQRIKCAHKTGEDDGITHDVGIIYTKHPFVLCMVSNETNVPAFERLIQDTALALAQLNNA